MLDWLFYTEGFNARSACGAAWSPSLVMVYQTSSTIIALCYVLIPLGMWRLFKRIWNRQPVQSLKVGRVLVAMFIASCGMTHAMDRMMFSWPVYHLTTVVLAICAVSSIATVIWLTWPENENV